MRLYSSVDELTTDLRETLIGNFNLQGYRVFLCDDDENTLNLLNSSESTAGKRVLRSQVDPYIRSDFSFENGSLFGLHVSYSKREVIVAGHRQKGVDFLVSREGRLQFG